MTGGLVDLVLAGGTLVTPEGLKPGAVAVQDGRIVAIGNDAAMPPAREVVDTAGCHVIPGAIDVHVHFREPGFSYKETWASATQAAAIGGVTTVFDMPNTNPPTADASAVRAKLALASAQAFVDFGVYGYIGDNNLDQLAPMAEAGSVAFKLYLGSDNPLVPCPNDGAVLDALAILAELGIRCTVHAENTPILAWRGAKLKAAGRHDLAAHLEQHADIATVEAVSRIALFSEWTGCPIHIAHENCRHSLPLIAAAKMRGVNITAETCPHYLYLSMEDAPRAGGSALRVKPPVREAGHAGPLWDALASGVIDMISTDHAPHAPAEKKRASIWDVAPGFPGVETSMRLMLTAVHDGRITLPDYVRIACEAPARAFGLFPQKGSLQPGADADLVVIDMNREGVIRGGDLHSLGNVTPFEGFRTRGLPVMTFLRGTLVAKDGQIVAPPGLGRPVRPRRLRAG
ncbi:MAG: dihydroorotase [Beijerinckiaceae bacterium]|nr:dihydroorotase [Beijerinckiaceae bacterium]MCZ8299229.1 dihydroorotase [Beijerinckiaceae bacterium]